MKVRLAFSVAAHLEPEILIIDEVLAVGDAEFQKKCLGKMEDVTGEGRTVLFVSHNLDAVERLCTTGVFLNKGRVEGKGSVDEVLKNYIEKIETKALLRNRSESEGTGDIKVVDIKIFDSNGNERPYVRSGESLELVFSFEGKREMGKRKDILIGVGLKTNMGIPVVLHHNRLSQDIFEEIPSKGEFRCVISELPLTEGIYSLSYSIMDQMGTGVYIDRLENAIKLEVKGEAFYKSGEIPPPSHGVCLIKAKWYIKSDMQVKQFYDV